MTHISTIAFAAVAGLMLPTAVSAAPKTTEADTSAPAQQSVAAKPQRYCVVGSVIGSQAPRRECKTLDTWLAEGFDPRAKK